MGRARGHRVRRACAAGPRGLAPARGATRTACDADRRRRARASRSRPALAGPLREACAAARDHGLGLALENHGDLTATQIERLLEEVGQDLRVCFDTANALRVGDDVAAAARRLAPAIEIVHLKDCVGSWEDPVAGPVSVPLGEGVIPVDEVLDACPDALVCIELGQLSPAASERVLVGTYVEYLRSSSPGR